MYDQHHFTRVADEVIDSLSPKEIKQLRRDADRLIPPSVSERLRKAFRVNGMPFFQFYTEMYMIRLGGPVDPRLKARYKQMADRLAQIKSPVDGRPLSPLAVNQIALTRRDVNLAITRIMRGNMSSMHWGQFNNIFVPLLMEVAKDKGVFLRSLRTAGTENIEAWATFRLMSPKQEQIEKLRDEDPEAYVLMERLGKSLAEIDAGIIHRIEAEGKTVKKSFLAGRPVLIGVDPVTGEEAVYDRDGEVIILPMMADPKTGEMKPSKDPFYAKVRQKSEALGALTKVPTRTVVSPTELRTIKNEWIEEMDGGIEWDAITDDKAKQARLTRIFPTKRLRRYVNNSETGETRIEELKVIVGGRYKGVYLDDMINSEGRLIEGTAYTYDTETGRTSTVPQTMDPPEREPYVTVADIVEQKMIRPAPGQPPKLQKVTTQKLYMKIDGGRQSTALRNMIRSLACNTGKKSGCIPSVVYEPVEGSNAAGFYFDAKDFGIIMGSLQGMSLSTGALNLVKEYYKELAAAEQATKVLDAYEPEALRSENEEGDVFAFIKGSFGKQGDWRPFDLRKKQKESLAWLDANGNSGVCALDTGLGKTATSIAMMLKLTRDGFTESDSTYTKPDGTVIQTNGRFLFVCPPDLKGNIRKEIRHLISDPKVMLDRLDVISYGQFVTHSKNGKVPKTLSDVPFWKERAGKKAAAPKGKTKTWDPALYVAIFFDEAQAMKNPTSSRAVAALKLWHPRKICLTASPMERNPMEAYVLAAISKNTQLFGRDLTAQKNRQEMRRFKERFCEIVGGRIVGVQQDPLVLRDLHTWIKRNIFYADKTDVEEYKLPMPNITTSCVEMPEEVEALYRDVTSQFAIIMQGAARKFSTRKKTDAYGDRQAERLFSVALAPVVGLLTKLANRPGEAMRDIAYAIDTGNFPNATKLPIKPIQNMIKKWQEQLSAEDLRSKAAAMGNPKLAAMEETLAAKLERAQGSRALVFADDKHLCMEAGEHLARTIAGTHVVALSDAIYFFSGGQQLTEMKFPLDRGLLERLVPDEQEQQTILQKTGGVTVHSLPFRKRPLKLHPSLPGKQGVHESYVADDWQQFVLKEIVYPNPKIKTCTLLGKTYMYGHNLQAFNTVIHLDRNNWNSESMKQRTARSWRQGQEQVVDEVTLDMVYRPDDNGVMRDEADKTLDQIRAAFQAMDAALFDDMIKAAQSISLGEEWENVKKKDASLWRLDERVLQMLASPYIGRVKEPN